MTRRDRIETVIQQTTDQRLLRLLNRESWREFFFPSEQLESNGVTAECGLGREPDRGVALPQGRADSCALTAPPEAQ